MEKCIPAILTSLCVLFLYSCQNEIMPDTEPPIPETEISFEEAKSIIAKLGFDVSTLEEKTDYYVVEGCITFEKKDMHLYRSDATRQVAYSDAGATLSYATYMNPIYIYIDSSVSSWTLAIESAMQGWNEVENCPIRLIRTTNKSQAHTEIYFDRYTGIASAAAPANGKPGKHIRINIDSEHSQMGSWTESQKTNIVIHEFGHTLGFAHSNLENNNSRIKHIPYTPEITTNSVMRHDGAGVQWNGFSPSDIDAIHYMFPIVSSGRISHGTVYVNTPTVFTYINGASSRPIYRHHFRSSSNSEMVEFNDGSAASLRFLTPGTHHVTVDHYFTYFLGEVFGGTTSVQFDVLNRMREPELDGPAEVKQWMTGDFRALFYDNLPVEWSIPDELKAYATIESGSGNWHWLHIRCYVPIGSAFEIGCRGKISSTEYTDWVWHWFEVIENNGYDD